MKLRTSIPGYRALDGVFGRDRELAELRRRLEVRESFVLHGPPGAGKTFLLRQVISSFPRVLYCDDTSISQGMFRGLATELLRDKNRHVASKLGRGGAELRRKSAIAVRGIVLDALHEGSYSAVLDHLRCPSAALACDIRDLRNWGNTCVIAVARSAHMEEMGYTRSYFALQSERMELKNFDGKEALAFAEYLAQRSALYASNREEFLRKVVEFSSGAPGAIATMISMASLPQYRCGDHIKVSPLYIDSRLAWHAANAY
jgi:AAA ATPase domain